MPHETPSSRLGYKKARTANIEPTKTKTVQRLFQFSSLPQELQDMIWEFVLDRQSCHTFSIYKSYSGPLVSRRRGDWDIIVKARHKTGDHSSWRLWENLHCLRNFGFIQTLFRCTKDLQRIRLHSGSGDVEAIAEMDVASDLMILEFNRGSKAVEFNWHEHADLMASKKVREKFIGIKKVAVRYKTATRGANGYDPGPFCCTCTSPQDLGCDKLQHCPFEAACFLDCFPHLEEFYIIGGQATAEDKAFAAEYRSVVLKNGLCFRATFNDGGTSVVRSFDVARFFDTKFEYLQHLPTIYSPALMQRSPFLRGEARRLAIKSRAVYTSRVLDEPFFNSLKQRRKVKFGLLIPYQVQKWKVEIS